MKLRHRSKYATRPLEITLAFRTGTYNGKSYSGQYGDLAATVAAILLEPEARSGMLDYDPTFGRLREPLLKVIACVGVARLRDIQCRCRCCTCCERSSTRRTTSV